MAFCNSCGATLGSDAKFCNKCGAATDGTSVAPALSASAPASAEAVPAKARGGSSALKIVLIIVGVVVLLGVLAVASVGFFFWHVARHSHVSQDGDNVKVETPFGTVESSKDPNQAVKDLGVDIYPEPRPSAPARPLRLSRVFTPQSSNSRARIPRKKSVIFTVPTDHCNRRLLLPATIIAASSANTTTAM
jgi:hypothetical protein